MEPHQVLGELLEREKERIVRLWARRVLAELLELPLPRAELRRPLTDMLDELLRLLKTRGDEALRLWPESLRSHAQVRYFQRFDAGDLARELKSLHEVILYVYGKRHGVIEPELAEYLAQILGEATAAMESSFARVLRTEEVRFKEASLMESILHHVDIGIWLAELDGSLAYATPAVGRLLGLPTQAFLGGQELLAACLSRVRAHHLDGRVFRVQEMPYLQVLKEQELVPNEWMRFQRLPDKQEVFVELSAMPIWSKEPERKLLGVVQTMTDRTEAARKTAELSRAYADLRKLQGRLLQRTRVQALGQLAGGAAHALNNLLHVMRLRLVLLKKEYRQEHLDALDKTVGSIGDLVARLQEFSVAREEGALQQVDVSQLVQEAYEIIGNHDQPPEAAGRFRWSLTALGQVEVDPPLLREIVVNLLDAAKERSAPSGAVGVQSTLEEGAFVLRISDEGPALSETELGQLFEPWAKEAGKPRQSFFLSLGRTQVRQWGGDLKCQNRADGPGVVCELRLPLFRPAAKPSLPPEASPLPRPKIKKVLVVDDDVEASKMMAQVLDEEGHVVRTVHSAKDALRAWEEEPFDVALLDALMPEVSGWELARALRQKTPHALLGMVTGADVRGQSRDSLSTVDAVFHKPVEVEALEEFLAQETP